jgi:Na+/melibiose symporter-like transporter
MTLLVKLQAPSVVKLRDNIAPKNCSAMLHVIRKPTLLLMGLAVFLRWGCGFSRGFFDPTYYIMVFPEHKTAISWVLCVSLLACSGSSYWLGKLSDWVYPKCAEVRALLVSAVMGVSLPFIYFSYHSDDFVVAMIFLATSYIVAEAYNGCLLGTIVDYTQVDTRGLETGFIFTLGYAGGMVYNSVLGNFALTVSSLRSALCCSVMGSFGLAGVCCLLLPYVRR